MRGSLTGKFLLPVVETAWVNPTQSPGSRTVELSRCSVKAFCLVMDIG